MSIELAKVRGIETILQVANASARLDLFLSRSRMCHSPKRVSLESTGELLLHSICGDKIHEQNQTCRSNLRPLALSVRVSRSWRHEAPIVPVYDVISNLLNFLRLIVEL